MGYGKQFRKNMTNQLGTRLHGDDSYSYHYRSRVLETLGKFFEAGSEKQHLKIAKKIIITR